MEKNSDVYNLSALLKMFGVFESTSKLIQVLFLKTIIDDTNKYENLNLDTMKILFEYQKLFNAGELTEEYLYKTFKAVEEANNLHNNELTSGINLFRFYFERDNQKRINSNLKAFEIPSNSNDRKIMLLDILGEIGVRSGRQTCETICSPSIYRVAKKILKIDSNDEILNTFAGNSAFILNLDNFKNAQGYEINIETLTITYMLKIMCDIKNYNVKLSDFYSVEDYTRKFDKIFTDGPIGVKVRNLPESSESDVLNITKTYELLKKDGTAVITVPNKVIFSGNRLFCEMRRRLSSMGIKAIIMLPNNVLYGTAIPINLFVIQKNYTGDIMLINPTDDMFDSTKLSRTIKNDAIELIAETIEESKVIEGYSYLIDPNELFGDGSNPVSLQKYFMVNEKKSHRNIEEIDEDIVKVIEKIYSLNKE